MGKNQAHDLKTTQTHLAPVRGWVGQKKEMYMKRLSVAAIAAFVVMGSSGVFAQALTPDELARLQRRHADMIKPPGGAPLTGWQYTTTQRPPRPDCEPKPVKVVHDPQTGFDHAIWACLHVSADKPSP